MKFVREYVGRSTESLGLSGTHAHLLGGETRCRPGNGQITTMKENMKSVKQAT